MKSTLNLSFAMRRSEIEFLLPLHQNVGFFADLKGTENHEFTIEKHPKTVSKNVSRGVLKVLV